MFLPKHGKLLNRVVDSPTGGGVGRVGPSMRPGTCATSSPQSKAFPLYTFLTRGGRNRKQKEGGLKRARQNIRNQTCAAQFALQLRALTDTHTACTHSHHTKKSPQEYDLLALQAKIGRKVSPNVCLFMCLCSCDRVSAIATLTNNE